jgi:murein DD-endopeptidase MepM/ murein hydrolase activator NlpD
LPAPLTGAAILRDGGTEFYAHVFPVQGPHGTRGPIGEFGAPRDGGRTHEGFDVVAACRTPLVAAATGRVLRTGYDPVLYGNYLLIHGQGEDRSYFYAHMIRPAAVHRGDRIWAGERAVRSARPATPVPSAATSTSRSTSTAGRSIPSPP